MYFYIKIVYIGYGNCTINYIFGAIKNKKIATDNSICG